MVKRPTFVLEVRNAWIVLAPAVSQRMLLQIACANLIASAMAEAMKCHEEVHMDKVLQRRNRWLLACYLLLAVLCLLPATGVLFNDSSPVLGVPLSVFWLTLCFVAMAGLTVVGYVTIFRPWSERIDRMAVDKDAEEVQS